MREGAMSLPAHDGGPHGLCPQGRQAAVPQEGLCGANAVSSLPNGESEFV